jgi:hypothetical protein
MISAEDRAIRKIARMLKRVRRLYGFEFNGDELTIHLMGRCEGFMADIPVKWLNNNG